MNQKHIHQSPYEPLTEKGKKQIKTSALLLKEKEIDALLTSPFTRARESAVIIGEVLDLPFTELPSVVEFARPWSLYGKRHYSLASFLYMWRLYVHRNDDNWNDNGAENMFAIRNRIIDAKRAIASADGKKIVVVSHAIFIDMFVQSVCADRSLNWREFASGLLGAKKIPNAGIVTFEVDDTAPPETCNWWLQTEKTNPTYLRLQ